MAARVLKARTSMITLLPHPTYTASRLKAHPLGAPHVARFEALKAEGKQVLVQEIEHIEAVTEAQAVAVAVDFRLDGYATRLSKVLLSLTGEDRTHPLYTHYFEKPLHELKKPILAGQLAAMKKWLVSLPKSPHPELSGMAAELATLVAEADAAVVARDAARQQNREFRDVGERRQWVDRLNATRKEVYGALAKLPYEHPGLPSDFADGFFLSGPEREDEEEDADTVEALEAQAAALRQALAEVEARLAEAAAAEAEAQRRDAEKARAAQRAALAELDRAAAELEQQRAALRAQLAAPPQ